MVTEVSRAIVVRLTALQLSGTQTLPKPSDEFLDEIAERERLSLRGLDGERKRPWQPFASKIA
ncbi:MAG: hypothetical protein AAF950_18265 [Pseudomonadota bacterium]